jgi:hypothetical protein
MSYSEQLAAEFIPFFIRDEAIDSESLPFSSGAILKTGRATIWLARRHCDRQDQRDDSAFIGQSFPMIKTVSVETALALASGA